MSSVRIVRSTTTGSLAQAARVQCGDVEIAAVSDGYIDLTLDTFSCVQPEQLAPLLTAAGLPERPVRVQISGFVIRDEDRIFLVDSGMGHYAGPTMGFLGESLALLGLRRDDVTDVLLTHLHRDHCGGLVDREESPLFGLATIHLPREEFAYWMDPSRMQTAPEPLRPVVRIAQTAMKAYQGRLHLMEPSQRITERIRMSPIAGHTPGMGAVWFRGEASQVCIWGDVIHCAALQFPLPDISVRFDFDQAQARSTRRDMLSRAATENWFVGGAHLPFPGIGTVTPGADGGYRFDALAQG